MAYGMVALHRGGAIQLTQRHMHPEGLVTPVVPEPPVIPQTPSAKFIPVGMLGPVVRRVRPVLAVSRVARVAALEAAVVAGLLVVATEGVAMGVSQAEAEAVRGYAIRAARQVALGGRVGLPAADRAALEMLTTMVSRLPTLGLVAVALRV